LSRSRCSEGGFSLWLGDKGIVNGKTSTIHHILTETSKGSLPMTIYLQIYRFAASLGEFGEHIYLFVELGIFLEREGVLFLGILLFGGQPVKLQPKDYSYHLAIIKSIISQSFAGV
jgi:hypothetical protein